MSYLEPALEGLHSSLLVLGRPSCLFYLHRVHILVHIQPHWADLCRSQSRHLPHKPLHKSLELLDVPCFHQHPCIHRSASIFNHLTALKKGQLSYMYHYTNRENIPTHHNVIQNWKKKSQHTQEYKLWYYHQLCHSRSNYTLASSCNASEYSNSENAYLAKRTSLTNITFLA